MYTAGVDRTQLFSFSTVAGRILKASFMPQYLSDDDDVAVWDMVSVAVRPGDSKMVGTHSVCELAPPAKRLRSRRLQAAAAIDPVTILPTI